MVLVGLGLEASAHRMVSQLADRAIDIRLVTGSHSVTIGEPGEIRITFYPAAVDLCHKEFEQLKRAIPFEAEKPPNAPATRRAPSQWCCPWVGGEKRAAMTVAAGVAVTSCQLMGSGTGGGLTGSSGVGVATEGGRCAARGRWNVRGTDMIAQSPSSD